MRLFVIDGLRGYAIISVLIRHFAVLPTIGLSQYSPITLFSVPVFFSISGLVLAYNYRNRKFSITNFYKRRILYIGIPYLIWAVIFTIIYERPFNDPSQVLLKSLYQMATGGYVTLWFVFVIFQFYMVFPLLIRLYNSMDITCHKLLVISTLIVGLSMFFLNWSLGIPMSHVVDSLGIPLWNFFLPWIFYYLLGMSIGYHWESVTSNLRKLRILKPLICMLYVVGIIFVPLFQREMGYLGYFTPTTFILCFLTIFLFLIMFNRETEKARPRILRILEFFGDFAFGVYLSHRPVATIFHFFIVILTTYQGSLMPILYLAFVPSICICLVSFLWRTPLGEFIIGKKPTPSD